MGMPEPVLDHEQRDTHRGTSRLRAYA
jgi:hypothetical protein